MKRITIAISLACLSQAGLAQDLASPTPTATPYFSRPSHPITPRRRERIQRRSAAQPGADSKGQAKANKKGARVAAATAQAQARQAARAREQAQREVAAQNRNQTRSEKPQLTSELMSRMGFSEQQIAEQKAREQSASAETKETVTPRQ
ncbi:MAG: hypothetical protein H0T83_07190 [Chthoniobacterales bacterium]|nr:hypothetical protein [Chthoniobacterales bacterium]